MRHPPVRSSYLFIIELYYLLLSALHIQCTKVPPLPQPDDVIGVSVVSDQRPPEWAVIAVSMSEVLPFSEAEQRGHYADGGGDGQIPLTCRLQDTGNFYGSSGQGGGKRPPKLGQIGRSKRVVIEEDERIEDVLMSEKAPPAV